VEFVPLAADLAEMLKVETPTKDGQLGFLINAVYPGSPAEKMQIKVGDILLRLQSPGMPYPIELSSRFAQERDGYSGRWGPPDDGEGQEEEGGPAEPTWKRRQNFLTRALDAVGVGKTVKLSYWRSEEAGKDKAVTVDYKIELAPPDQDSAPKWRNRKLGLTAKDVTYEVRYALNLKPPAGVLVATVENGSPTLVARIFPNEIVTRLDDKPLESARQMRDLVAAGKAAGKDKVRLTILRLGKTRFADLSITEYNPADDEGLDDSVEE
jgi:S1-C subfamily serine protease